MLYLQFNKFSFKYKNLYQSQNLKSFKLLEQEIIKSDKFLPYIEMLVQLKN